MDLHSLNSFLWYHNINNSNSSVNIKGGVALYQDLYGSVGSFLFALINLWIVFLFFQRLMNRYPVRNSWKKDIILTLIQSLFVLLIVFPLLVYLT